MARKTCFVAMPIRQPGTSEYQDYKALYDGFIKPIVSEFEYDVTRADEVHQTGAITKDIIQRLAEADLVIVDLTGLNPNVFYELGVRHSLRGSSTIMIQDAQRDDKIPFDLSVYRVIRFSRELPGLIQLRAELQAFIQGLAAGNVDRRDNPVHDALPGLPLNVLKAAQGSEEGQLLEQLAKAQKRIREYEEMYGKAAVEVAASSPVDVIRAALSGAQSGDLPSGLLEMATEATGNRDPVRFLEAVRRVMESPAVRLQPREYLKLSRCSELLGLPDVTTAIFDHGVRMYPTNHELRMVQIGHFAHSENLSERERARQELLSETGITISEECVIFPSIFGSEQAQLLGLLLDTYHRDELHNQALRITEAAVARFPNMCILCRNHARALDSAGQLEESIPWYQKALQCPDVDDNAAVWFGNELHNRHRNVDAAEAYLRACLIDDDAVNYSQLSDELSWAIRNRPKETLGLVARSLPDQISIDTVVAAITAAYSCPTVPEEAVRRIAEAARRIELDIDNLAPIARVQGSLVPATSYVPRMGFQERYRFAMELYSVLRSPLTDPTCGSES